MKVINSFGITDILSKFCLLLIAGYLAKALSPSIYGAWSLLLGLSLLLSNIASFGFSTSLQRFLPSSEENTQNTYLKISLLLTLAACVLIFIVVWAAGNHILDFYKIHYTFLPILYFVPFISFITCVENILDAFFKAREDSGKFIFFISIRTGIEIGFLLYLFQNHASFSAETTIKTLYNFLIFQVMSKLFFYSALLLIRSRKDKEETQKGDKTNKTILSFIKYGIPILISSLVLWSFSSLDRVILANHLTLHDLGVYSFGASIAAYTVYLGSFVFPLLMPQVSKSYDLNGNKTEIENIFNKSLFIFILTVSSLWVFISLFYKEIILLTAGKEYLDAAFPLLILSFYYGIDQAIGIWTSVYHIQKKPTSLSILRVCYLFFFLIVMFLHVQFFEAKYLPISILLSGTLYNLIIYVLSQRLIPIKMTWYNFALLIFSIALSLTIYLFYENTSILYKAIFFLLFSTVSASFILRSNKINVPYPKHI